MILECYIRGLTLIILPNFLLAMKRVLFNSSREDPLENEVRANSAILLPSSTSRIARWFNYSPGWRAAEAEERRGLADPGQ